MKGRRMHEQEWRKGNWTPEEDNLLLEYVRMHGEGRWSSVAGCSGLKRSGKSCRLRWVNYLRPGLKKCQLTPQEEGIIMELHALWGNKWSTIAKYLPGRTDNEIKNYWRTHFKKKGTPSQNQERQQHKVTFSRDQHQQQEHMNDLVLAHVEENKRGMIFESQAKIEETIVSEQHYSQSMMAQDVATWWDTVSENGLWSGFLWNQDNDQYPNEYVIKQSFSSCS